MLDKIFFAKIKYFLELIRFSNPTGFLLLMWPCWFSLAILQLNQLSLIKWYILYLVGAFLMRSAGCVINDIIDINIDKNIKRTSSRPLTSKKLYRSEAFIFLIFLLIPSFIILLNFNMQVILVGISITPLIIIYPFLKRYTFFPQIFLGVIFNFGIILTSLQFYHYLKLDFFILYFGCLFWTIGYDTIYAYQDKEDDIKNNIKSTAVFFQNKGQIFVKICYSIFIACIGYLGWKTSNNFVSLTVIIFVFFVMYYLLNRWKVESKARSKYLFKINNYVGLCFFIFLLIF